MEGINMAFFEKEKKQINYDAVDSLIGEKAKLKGELTSSGAVSVNGEFEGIITAKGDVIVYQGSKVVGNIQANNVVVSGKVDGDISAIQGLEILKSGRVNGDLMGSRVIIEEGALYCGKVTIKAVKSEEEVEKDDGREIEEKEEIEIVEENSEQTDEKESSQAQMF
jgi:cytoskeletal protein CcmA (bactofilin family)